MAAPEWRPPCDVAESAEEWHVTAELGGLDEDDLEILLYEDSVVIQGVRPWRGAVEGVRVHLAEVRYGPFRFALDLPPAVDRAAVRASYDRGMLSVVLPKAGERGAP
jgi:HSP20 family protein